MHTQTNQKSIIFVNSYRERQNDRSAALNSFTGPLCSCYLPKCHIQACIQVTGIRKKVSVSPFPSMSSFMEWMIDHIIRNKRHLHTLLYIRRGHYFL